MTEKKTNGIALDGASIPSMQLFTKGASIPTMQSFGGLGLATAGAPPVMQLAPVAPVTTTPVSSSQSGSNSQSSSGTTKVGSE